MLDMTRAREVFEASEDFTVGLEEEFQILDPGSRSLAHRFGELNALAQEDEVLAVAVAGELIESEIEIRSGKGESFDAATASQRDARARLFRLAADNGALLGATGTHPWSPWQEQRIIDTDHYRRVEEGLQYVAWRNNTFSLHVHVGIRGADRAVAVCDRLRPVLPELLAISANSPFLDGRDSGLHSARTQIFTKSFPRCGIPDPFGELGRLRGLRGLAGRAPARSSSTPSSGGACGPTTPSARWRSASATRSRAREESTALAGLIAACVAQAALDYDEGVAFDDPPRRLVEENFWRAIRYGLDGRMIDLERGEEFPAGGACPTGCWPGPRRPGRRWASIRRCPPRTARSASGAPWPAARRSRRSSRPRWRRPSARTLRAEVRS